MEKISKPPEEEEFWEIIEDSLENSDEENEVGPDSMKKNCPGLFEKSWQ